MNPLILSAFYLVLIGAINHAGENFLDVLWHKSEQFWADKQKVAAFQAAYQAALQALRKNPTLDIKERRKVADILKTSTEDTHTFSARKQKEIAQLVAQLEPVFLLEETPNITALAELCHCIAPRKQFDETALQEGLSHFIGTLRDELFRSEHFKQALLDNQAYWRSRQPLPDTEARYREQISHVYQELGFVGIRDPKDGNALPIQNIFIHLCAKSREQYASKERIPINDILRHNKPIMILGEPGAGKTTLLQYIAVSFAQHAAQRLGLQEKRLPLFIRLYDFVNQRAKHNQDYALLDYLHTHARENLSIPNLPPDFFQKALARGECCVCMDGLDELGQAHLRHQVVQIVTAFANHYPRNRFVFSSRIVGYEEAPLNRELFAHYTITPFSDEDIKTFVTHWYEAREKEPNRAQQLADDLITKIMAESAIRKLATNPLLLTIIALVHRVEADLPHQRVKLYEKCVATLVDTWEKAKNASQAEKERPHFKYRQHLLEQLAYDLHTQPGEVGELRELRKEPLKQKIASFLLANNKLNLDEEEARQESAAFIEMIQARTGLLVERGGDRFSFAHLSFQEYLAAQDIYKRAYSGGTEGFWQAIHPYLHQPHWHEVILLLIGTVAKTDDIPTQLVEKILQAGAEDPYEAFVPRHLFWAMRIPADRIEIEASLRDQIFNQLCTLIETGKEGYVKDTIALLRPLSPSAALLTRLWAIANQEAFNTRQRYMAAELLGHWGEKEKATPILLTLLKDKLIDYFQLFYIFQTLEIWEKQVQALPLLDNYLENPQIDSFVHLELMDIWTRWTNRKIKSSLILSLIKKMISQKNDIPYHNEIWQLIEKKEEVVSQLLDMMTKWRINSAEFNVIIFILKQIGEQKRIKSVLWTLFEDSTRDLHNRLFVAQQLINWEEADKVYSFVQTIIKEPNVNSRLQNHLAEVLERCGGQQQAISIWWNLAQDESIELEIQCKAVFHLRRYVGEQELSSIVYRLSNDEDLEAETQIDLMDMLLSLGKQEKVKQMGLSILEKPSLHSWTHWRATELLCKLGTMGEAIERLLVFAENMNVQGFARQRAIRKLREMQIQEVWVLKRLGQLINDKDDEVSVNAYYFLKQLLGAVV